MSELTQAIVRELLDYDPVSGVLTWKERDPKWFTDGYRSAEGNRNKFNATFAGKEALFGLLDGYKRGEIFGKSYAAHRIIWLWQYGYVPEFIDHKNGIRDDNRLENLREVTFIENLQNQRKRSTNKSGMMGVFQRPDNGRWRAYINYHDEKYDLGTFSTFEEAASARKAAELNFGFHRNHNEERAAYEIRK